MRALSSAIVALLGRVVWEVIMPKLPKMLTLAQAAEQLGLSPTTLRNQVLAGKLRAELVGKTYVVTPAEVERYRAERLGRIGRPRKDA